MTTETPIAAMPNITAAAVFTMMTSVGL